MGSKTIKEVKVTSKTDKPSVVSHKKPMLAALEKTIKDMGKRHISTHGDVENGEVAVVRHNPDWGYDLCVLSFSFKPLPIRWDTTVVCTSTNSTGILLELQKWEQDLTDRRTSSPSLQG